MADYSKDIERYLKGEMTPAERHALEKKSLSDPFLADALEGAEQIATNAYEQDIRDLYQAIDSSSRAVDKKNTFLFWGLRIAAGLLVLVIASYLILTVSDQIKPEPNVSSADKLEKKEADKLSPDSTTLNPTKNQLALAEDKAPPKKDVAAKQKSSGEEKDNSKPVIAEEAKTLSSTMDVVENEPQTEITKAEETVPVLNNSLEVEERKVSAVAANEAAKESAAAAPSRQSGATAKAKRSAPADQYAKQQPASSITGVVTSAEDGSPLPGVNVMLKGTTIGTITDVDGKFKLDSATLASTLVYSFIGLQTKEVNVSNFSPLNVEMNLDVTQLSEVVVTGYGYSNKSEETPTVDLAHPENGNRAYRKYLEENLVYPQSAIDNKVEGRVTVEFFVETNGDLSDFTVIKGIGNGCEEELIRLIRQGPKWIPTKKNNQAIRDKARVRLNFQIPGK